MPHKRTAFRPLLLWVVLGTALAAATWGRTRGSAPLPCDPALEPCLPERSAAPSDPGTPGPAPGAANVVLEDAKVCPGTAYLCAALEREDRFVVRRWKDFDGTIVVHVPRPDLMDPGAAQRLQAAAAAGVRLWNGHPFPVVVDERGTRTSHFAVRWAQGLGGSQIGLARTQWSPATGLQVLALELATQNPFSGEEMEPGQVRLVAAHEMGHALGLPHSDEPRDVMYPTNTATTLSARDYKTLQTLYRLEDGTVILRTAPRR